MLVSHWWELQGGRNKQGKEIMSKLGKMEKTRIKKWKQFSYKVTTGQALSITQQKLLGNEHHKLQKDH